jgi:CSLREA domain-containing protein
LPLALACIAAGSAGATAYTVTTTSDLGGNCSGTPTSCSLRQAINSAGAGPDSDTIAVPEGTFALPGGPLALGTTVVAINGAGPATVITGSDAAQVLNAAAGTDLTLRGLTIRDGSSGALDGGGIFMDDGSRLTAEDVLFEGNQTTNKGGAVSFDPNGTGTYTDVTFRENVASDSGGGVFMNFPSTSNYTRVVFQRNKSLNGDGGGVELFSPNTSTFTDVLFDSNEAEERGGAVMFNSASGNPAVTTFTRVNAKGNKALDGSGGAVHFNSFAQPQFRESTFSGNSAAAVNGGGAIRFNESAQVTLINTTVSGNTAGGGPGGGLAIDDPQSATISNSTIAGNSSSTAGGGIWSGGAANVTLANALLANNTAPVGTNCEVGLTSSGGNLESADTCGLGAGELRNTNPLLGLLADNGGATQTQALPPGSPALNAGVASNCPPTDQRGVLRALGPCDIGAFELAPPIATTGVATGVKAARATLGGSVTPNQRVASWHFEFGRTTRYGSSTPSAEVGGGPVAAPVSAPVTRLKQDTLYHFRLVATTSDGSAQGADARFRTANRRPDLSRFRITPRQFEVAGASARIAARRGSAFKFRLSEKATVRIIICGKAGKRCKKVGTLRRKGKAGRNRVRFSGKLRRRTLKAGRYRATARATDRRKARSRKRSVSFSIVD